MGFYPGIAIVCLDDFERNQFLVFLDRLVIKAATDQALDSKQGVFRICDCLTFGRLTNQTLTILGKCHD